MAINPKTDALIKSKKREISDRDTLGEGHMQMEAEVGIRQNKDFERLLAAPRSQDRGMEQFFRGVFRKFQPCWIP